MTDRAMTDLDLVDAERFADALETIEEGGEPDLDPREDPTLTALATLASGIRDAERSATETPRFDSYRTRSRGYLLRSLELPRLVARDHVLRRVEHAMIPRETMPTALVPVVVAEPRRRRVPFLRWSYLAPVASAAAAAVAVLAFIAAQPGAADEPAGGEQTAAAEPAPNAAPTATAAQIDPPSALGSPTVPDRPLPWEVLPPLPTRRPVAADLDRINELISTVASRVADGVPVEAELLRAITESTAAVADRIELQPDSVSRVQVIAYIQAAADGRSVLAAVRADAETKDALSAARRAAQDGVVVASTYFQQRP